MSKAETKRYHHGELRNALLTAALEVLERQGAGAISLRGLARIVGVSPMAPYHHFADREALLAAVATAGFERLQSQKIENERDHISAREALAAGAENYVRFILKNPNLYRLMFGSEFSDKARHSELQLTAAAPAKSLARLVARFQDEHGIKEPRVEEAAQMLWGLSHGIGILAADGQLRRATAPQLSRHAAEACIEGWLSRK